MTIKELTNIEPSKPFINKNFTIASHMKYWFLLIKEYIDRFGGSSTYSPYPSELEDGGELDLETGKAGMGRVMIGDADAHAVFTFSSTGAIILIDATLNVVTTDTASTLSIYWDATSSTVKIKNNLGSTLSLSVYIKYNNV